MVASPGTIPFYPPYQPGGLPLTGAEILYLVNSATATAAASFRWAITDIPKVAAALPGVNPSNSDLIMIMQAASGLPKACQVGNLGVPAGNVVVGGLAGQLYFKNSASNFDASWTTSVPFLALQSATLGSATITSLFATNATVTNATVSNLQLLTGTIGTATVTNLTATNMTATNATLSNLQLLTATIGTGTVTNLTVTNMTATNATLSNLQLLTGTIGTGTITTGIVTNLTATNATITNATVSNLQNLTATISTLTLTNPLAVVNGGLATNVLGTFSVLIGGANQTAAVRAVLATSAGLVLTSNGSTSAPSWFGSMVLLNTLSPSAVASTTDTTSLTSTYRDYMIMLENVCPATNTTVLQLTIATSGANFVSGGYVSINNVNMSAVLSQDSSTTVILLSGIRATTAVATSTTAGVSGMFTLRNPASATLLKQFIGQLSYQASNGALGTSSWAMTDISGLFSSTTSPITGLAFGFSSGNIQTGTIKIWGMV